MNALSKSTIVLRVCVLPFSLKIPVCLSKSLKPWNQTYNTEIWLGLIDQSLVNVLVSMAIYEM